jgi:hypothetical protein
LKIEIEKAKLLPEFGVNYVHMLTLEMVRNFIDGDDHNPYALVFKMNKANISSFKIKK